jgi:hypothetical protein
MTKERVVVRGKRVVVRGKRVVVRGKRLLNGSRPANTFH